jgi:hypothetical protein
MSKKADARFSDTRRIKGSGNVFLTWVLIRPKPGLWLCAPK